MSVYKEGWMIVDQITECGVRLYEDACDFGAPTIKNDKLWNQATQLAEWYGNQDTRKVTTYGTGTSISIRIELMFEGDVRKGETAVFELEYHTTRKDKGRDGFLTVYSKSNALGKVDN